MKKTIMLMLFSIAITAKSQNYILKAGDRFPDVTFHTLVNAPAQTLDLNNYPSRKFFIINFWGTWCSPCIPEMDALSKLQNKYMQQIQIIGYADDPKEKLVKYIAKKPSKIWLVSDTSYLLYKMLNLASVGHCLLLDEKRNIAAVVKTDSVNEEIIEKLLKGERIKSNATITEVSLAEKDAFGVDSLLRTNFTIRGYMKGEHTMGKSYAKGPFANRRRSYFNITPSTMYKDAYDITSEKQVIREYDEKQFENFNDNNQRYCFDLLVAPEQKDSLKLIMQRKLNESLPIKGRLETQTMPVYILKQKPGVGLSMTESAPETTFTYGFSGNGFDGKAITVEQFTHLYLNNELELPVIDETGLTKRYDIKTTNDMRDKENILKAVDKLGLTLEKAERPVKVLVLYRR